MKKLDLKRMIKAYQTVIEIGDPQEETVKQAHDILQDFDQHLREHGNSSLEAYLKGAEIFERALEAMNDKKWTQAISLFQKCTQYSPHHPQPYGNMGICYGKLGQKALALQALDMALELDPDYEIAIVNRAIVASLQEGNKLSPDKVESIEYYTEYARNGKSYIQTIDQKRKSELQS